MWERDVELDALEDSVFRDLFTYMMEDPRNISFCTHLLFCSKNIERIGDHATNIAETVFISSPGETLPADRPKGGVPIAAAAASGANVMSETAEPASAPAALAAPAAHPRRRGRGGPVACC